MISSHDLFIFFEGALFVLSINFLLFIFFCTKGGIELIKNPVNDPDNPFILRFDVDPTKWLSKKYIILKVRKKNR